MKKNKYGASHQELIAAEASSGNVFRDMGSSNPDEALMKAEVALVIGKLIRQMDLTQAQVAKKLGIDQPKVSLLLRGRLRDFSIMRLFRFLHALEQDIKIVISPHKKARKAGTSDAVEVELLGV
jgi:predicted XRE-type DNA-binding protein